MKKSLKIIVSGGGTGGTHFFPLFSIANELKEIMPDCEVSICGCFGGVWKWSVYLLPDIQLSDFPVMGFPRKPGLKNYQILHQLI